MQHASESVNSKSSLRASRNLVTLSTRLASTQSMTRRGTDRSDNVLYRKEPTPPRHTAQVFSMLPAMPDNTRPPRNLGNDDQQPNLGTRALMRAVEELAAARSLAGARVAYKRNAKGEHVVALIFAGFERT